MIAHLNQVWLVARYERTMLLRSWAFRIIAFLCFACALGIAAGKIILAYIASSEAFLGPMFTSTNSLLRGLATVASLLTFTTPFFANDMGSRDRRLRIYDVVASRPIPEGLYVCGRILGMLIPLTALMALTLALMLLINWLVGVRTASFTQYVPFFLVFNVLSIAFAVTFTTFLSAILRHRLVSSLVSLTFIMMAGFYLVNLSEVFDIVGARMSGSYSELIGYGPIAELAMHRMTHFLLTLCLVAATVYLYPRSETSRGSRLTTGVLASLTLGSAAFVVLLVVTNKRADARHEVWRDALREVSTRQAAGVSHYEMDVHLLPRKGAMRGRAAMSLFNRGETAADTFIFVLNPGLKLDSLKVAEDPGAEFKRNGPVIEVKMSVPLAPGDTLESVWEYGGRIDPLAAWLWKTPKDLRSEKKLENLGDLIERTIELNLLRQLDRYMGNLSGWVGRRFCFLLPESNWYPTPNSTFGHTYPDKRPDNFATAQIRIHMPEAWTGVTQGTLVTDDLSGDERVRVFEADIPVPQFSLTAGEYAETTAKIDGIHLSFLYAPVHEKNVTFFADATEELGRLVSDSLENIEDKLGVAYPYGSLSLVEVPAGCRLFGDFWEARNLYSQPGVLLMSETGFFGATFDQTYKRSRKRTQAEGTGATDAQIKAELLSRFFVGNVFAGDLEVNLIPNYWEYQVGASGDAYPAVGMAFTASLAERALDRHQRHMTYTLNNVLMPDLHLGFPDERLDSPDISVDRRVRRLLNKELLRRSMTSMVPGVQEDDFFRPMNQKTDGFVKTLELAMGEDAWSTFLPTLLEAYRFKTLSMADFEREAATHSERDLSWVFDQFLREAVVPGYAIAHAEAYEIDNGQRERLFQAIVRVDNLERGRGFVKLVIELDGPGSIRTVEREVQLASLEAKEIRTVLREKPISVRLTSPFALNVQDPVETLYVPLETRNEQGEDSVRTVDAAPTELAVIVDNTDSGFSILTRDEYIQARAGKVSERHEVRELFNTRPEYVEIRESGIDNGGTARWARQMADGAYGKYERTRLIKQGGDGDELAVWTASLPQEGTYEVFMYVSYYAGRPLRGTYQITVEDAVAMHEIEFDLPEARDGWNSLGVYKFEPGTRAEVTLSDERGDESTARRRRVHADAVKWVYSAPADAVQ